MFRTASSDAVAERLPGQGAAVELPARQRAEPALRRIARKTAEPLIWRHRLATAQARVFPGAIIIGAQKSGTSALHAYMSRHPAVLSGRVKEVHYFDEHYERGPNFYRAHFPTAKAMSKAREQTGSQPLSLDASPYYLLHPLVPHRVRALLPQARLIAVLRDPADRAISHHNHEVQVGIETASLDDAIALEGDRLAGQMERLESEPLHVSFEHRHFSYATRGRYAEQLERWLSVFPREQLLVLDHARLLSDPAATMERVWEHVRLPSHQAPRYEAWGAREYVTSVEEEQRDRLREYFEPHNRRLWDLIGEQFDWRTSG